MLIAAIILGILALACGISWLAITDEYGDRNDYLALGFLALGFVWFLAFMGSLNVKISSQELTGYIYSSSNRTGYTTAHIRFSENAGQDVQPEFCVRADSKPGREIQKYVGSGTKVKIHIPSYFYFANNPFACGTTNMTITEVK